MPPRKPRPSRIFREEVTDHRERPNVRMGATRQTIDPQAFESWMELGSRRPAGVVTRYFVGIVEWTEVLPGDGSRPLIPGVAPAARAAGGRSCT